MKKILSIILGFIVFPSLFGQAINKDIQKIIYNHYGCGKSNVNRKLEITPTLVKYYSYNRLNRKVPLRIEYKNASKDWKTLTSLFDLSEFKSLKSGKSRQPADGCDQTFKIFTKTENIIKTNINSKELSNNLHLFLNKLVEFKQNLESTKEITFQEIYPYNPKCQITQSQRIDQNSYEVALGTFKIHSQNEWNTLKQKLNLKSISCEDQIDFDKHSVIVTSAGYGSSSEWEPFYKTSENMQSIFLHYYQESYSHPFWPITDDYSLRLKIVTIPKTNKPLTTVTNNTTDDFFIQTSDSTRVFKYPMQLSHVIGANGNTIRLKEKDQNRFVYKNGTHFHLGCRPTSKDLYWITNNNEIITKYHFPVEDVECPKKENPYPMKELINSFPFQFPINENDVYYGNLIPLGFDVDLLSYIPKYYNNARFYSNANTLYQVFEINTASGGFAQLANVFTRIPVVPLDGPPKIRKPPYKEPIAPPSLAPKTRDYELIYHKGTYGQRYDYPKMYYEINGTDYAVEIYLPNNKRKSISFKKMIDEFGAENLLGTHTHILNVSNRVFNKNKKHEVLIHLTFKNQDTESTIQAWDVLLNQNGKILFKEEVEPSFVGKLKQDKNYWILEHTKSITIDSSLPKGYTATTKVRKFKKM